MGWGGKKAKLDLVAPPPVPSPTTAAEKAAEEAKKKRRRLSRTILTSPQGVLEPAIVARKTLLGE